MIHLRLPSKLIAFFRRDFAIQSSYRSAFVLELGQTLFAAASFYYLSRFIEGPLIHGGLPGGHSYFSFALVGVAFVDYMSVALNTFDQAIDVARGNGTLEALLVTDTSLPAILAGSGTYPFVFESMRTAVYLAWAVLLFHFPVGQANWPGAVIVLAVSILAFTGIGILSASYILLFKRGNPAKWLLLSASGVLGGMMYPVSVLPRFLQFFSRLLPITYSLEGLRAALLDGASLTALWPSIRALVAFAIVLLPVSFVVFSWALRRTKINGTLSHH